MNDPDADLFDFFQQLFFLTVVGVATGISWDIVVAWFATRFVSFVNESSYLVPQAGRIVIAFTDGADYEKALTSLIPFGNVHNPPGYNPFINPSNFHRIFLSGKIWSFITLEHLKGAFSAAGIKWTSISFDSGKGYIVMYLEDEMEWIRILSTPYFSFELPEDPSNPLFLRNVVGLAATGNPEWVKLFIANLPRNTVTAAIRHLFKTRFGAIPEIIALYHYPETNALANWGYVISKAPEVLHALLTADQEMRTVFKGDPRQRVIKILPAKSKKRTTAHNNAPPPAPNATAPQ